MLNMLRRLLSWPFLQRQERLLRTRQGYGREDFLVELGPDCAAAETWAVLREQAEARGFKPMPEDHLGSVFGLADDDLDEVGLELLRRCGCRIPPPEETSTMPRVETVADLVAFIRAMQPSSGSNPERCI